jgi:hypothetical protein
MKRISLPREHGGYLTIGGATAAGMWLAPAPLAAFGVGLALAASFFARGPIESRCARPLDLVALGGYATLAMVGALLAKQPLVLLLAGALVGVSAWVRARKSHRESGFELSSMAGLGAAAGPIALAGGASPGTALIASLVVGTHAALSVPLVRTELRPRERDLRSGADALAALGLTTCAATVSALGMPLAALALVPRALHLVARRLGWMSGWRASQVGLRETLELATVLIVLGVLR